MIEINNPVSKACVVSAAERNSRNLSKFDQTRNCIFWSTRKRTLKRVTQKTNNQIHSYNGKLKEPHRKSNIKRELVAIRI